MAQSKIIQSLCDMVDGKIVVENEEYKKQKEIADKWYDKLEEYIQKDEKLFDIFFHFDWEYGVCEAISNDIYFREGFLCGARLVMEILYDEKRG